MGPTIEDFFKMDGKGIAGLFDANRLVVCAKGLSFIPLYNPQHGINERLGGVLQQLSDGDNPHPKNWIIYDSSFATEHRSPRILVVFDNGVYVSPRKICDELAMGVYRYLGQHYPTSGDLRQLKKEKSVS